jgi:hypothetical protein
LASCVSSDFDNAENRCEAIGDSAPYAGCIDETRQLLAEESEIRKSFCYSVADRVVCKPDPLHSYVDVEPPPAP